MQHRHLNHAPPRFEELAQLQSIAWFRHHDARSMQVVAFQQHPGQALSITSPAAQTRGPRRLAADVPLMSH